MVEHASSRSRWRGSLLLGASFLLVVILGGAALESVGAAVVEMAREIRYSEDVGEQMRTAWADMLRDLAQYGCLSGLAYAYSKEEDPGVVVLVVRCLESGGQAKE